MAPSRDKLLLWFIEDLTDQTLDKVRNHPGTVIEDENFHLDVQGKTTDGRLNLQIQVDARPKKTSLQDWATRTVSGPAFVTLDQDMSPEEIRQTFQSTRVNFNDKSQRKGNVATGTKMQDIEEKPEGPDQGGNKDKQKNKKKRNKK